MAAKKIRIATIKNPKIGNKYFFIFAGSIVYGTYIEECTSLSKQHGHLHMWFHMDGDKPNVHGKLMTYPISITCVANNLKDL